MNLAVNARDAMPAGGTLTFAAREVVSAPDQLHTTPRGAGRSSSAAANGPAAEYVQLLVCDTGTGMAPATLARAAEPFFTTKPVGQGTGLGLPMARGFAQQSGGGFAIDSVQGRGTRVMLWLPRADPAALATTADRSATVDDSATRPAARVLVVGDATLVRPPRAGPRHRHHLRLRLIREARQRRPVLLACLLTGFADATVRLDPAELDDARTLLLRKPVTGDDLLNRAAALLARAAE